VPEWHTWQPVSALNFVSFQRKIAQIALFHGVGDGLGAAGKAVAGTAKPALRAAAAPKLLEIATPIPNWSSVMGPIDSTM
jgi:hypothetical protein